MTTWEQDLIRKVQIGDSRAFGPLVRMYEPGLKNSITRILGDPDAAADVTQEAFIAVFENIHRYNPDHRFFSWVYRIALNGALNKIHQRKFGLPLVIDDVSSPDPNPEAWTEARELAALIHQAVGSLKFKYRVLLVLRHYLDCSYAEIAKITDLPVTTVRSRLHTARVLLKNELLSQIGDTWKDIQGAPVGFEKGPRPRP